MESQAAIFHSFTFPSSSPSSSFGCVLNHRKAFAGPFELRFNSISLNRGSHGNNPNTLFPRTAKFNSFRFLESRLRATLDEREEAVSSPVIGKEEQEPHSKEVEKSVNVLKNAAKTRKVAAEEVLSAFSVIEKAKLDSSGFLDTLGGSMSPGRTWMLIFTAEKQLKRGRYFPITAVQKFDAAAKRIENGVYLGPIGCLTFEGRFSWKKRILAFIFERIRIKIGPFGPLEFNLGQKEDREPTTEDPFFIWFYVDEEIAVARGRGGGTAVWCRCRRVSTS